MKDVIKIKYPNTKTTTETNHHTLRCGICDERAYVLVPCDTHEEFYCAQCYLERFLNAVEVTLTDDGSQDVNSAVIGKPYRISGYKYESVEPMPKEWGWSKFSCLKPYADKIMYIGDEEVCGKRTKMFQVCLKPEYQKYTCLDRLKCPIPYSSLVSFCQRWIRLVEKRLQAEMEREKTK